MAWVPGLAWATRTRWHFNPLAPDPFFPPEGYQQQKPSGEFYDAVELIRLPETNTGSYPNFSMVKMTESCGVKRKKGPLKGLGTWLGDRRAMGTGGWVLCALGGAGTVRSGFRGLAITTTTTTTTITITDRRLYVDYVMDVRSKVDTSAEPRSLKRNKQI